MLLTAAGVRLDENVKKQTSIEDFTKQSKKQNNFGKMLLLFTCAYMTTDNRSLKSSFQSQIESLNIDNLSYSGNRVTESDKEKLKFVQEFLLVNLDELRKIKKEDPSNSLDELKIILLVMKQKLIKPTYKEISTKNKIESSLRAILQDEPGVSPEEVDTRMDYNHFIVDKMLGLKQPMPEIKEGETDRVRLRAAIDGDARASRRMVEFYHKDFEEPDIATFRPSTIRNLIAPRRDRLMFFCSWAAAVLGESDSATCEFYIERCGTDKIFTHSDEKKKILNLMKNFYLYSFEISASLIEQHKVRDPLSFQFGVLDCATKSMRFNAEEITVIRERLIESMKSALVEEGEFTKDEAERMIAKKEKEVTALKINIELIKVKQKTIQITSQTYDMPVVPPKAALPSVATTHGTLYGCSRPLTGNDVTQMLPEVPTHPLNAPTVVARK